MLSIILFILIISAFALFACFRFDKAFEEALPISCMGIILILFLFGMINVLQVGAVVICAAAFFIYGYTCFYVSKNGGIVLIKKKLFNIITPGSLVFLVLAILLSYWNKDRLAMTTDEFSHWLDTVVIMTRIDRFGTAPNSTAVFASYPPAMSLFQYLLEKINIVVTGDFSEWKCYFAYQLLAVIIMLPFMRVDREEIAKKVAGVIMWFIVLIAPLFFFKDAYSSLYIDQFLGVLAGCGFGAIALTKEKDVFHKTYITMICAVLTLAKDVGIYLSIFVSLFYAIDYLSRKKSINAFTPMLAMFAAKMLWKLELAVTDTYQKFSSPIEIKLTFDTIRGQGNEFTNIVYNNFKNALTYSNIYYERIGLNYVAVMTLMTVLFIMFFRRLYLLKRVNKAIAVAGAIIPSVTVVFYVLSLFPLYISRFVQEEAENLASFERYCGIVYLTGLLFIIWLLRDIILDIQNEKLIIVISILMVLSVFHSKINQIDDYASRKTVADSLQYRQYINILSEKIKSNTAEDATILLVGEDYEAVYSPVLSTIAKPRVVVYSDYYFHPYIDQSGPGMSLDDLKTILRNEYDYVAVYSVTENFKYAYLGLFENYDDLHSLSLYAVDKNTGMLTLIN